MFWETKISRLVVRRIWDFNQRGKLKGFETFCCHYRGLASENDENSPLAVMVRKQHI